MDGKDVRGASKQTQDGRRMLVAAVEQGSGLVLGQLEISSKTNEIPALRELAGGLGALPGAPSPPMPCMASTRRRAACSTTAGPTS